MPGRFEEDDLHRFDHIEPDRAVLSKVSGADRQDERLACSPTHESQHRCVLRLGGCVFLERQRVAVISWAILQRPAVRPDPDSLQSAHRGLRERRLSARREGVQESETSSGCAPAYLVSDSLPHALLSNASGLLQASHPRRPPDLLPHRLDDGCVVPAGLRSASPVRWKTERVASRISPFTAGCARP
jgi:hypothetical protein